MLTQAQTTKPATDALTELVAEARKLRDIEAGHGQPLRAAAFEGIAHTLDAARTRLVEDGVEYLDAAWAFVSGARVMLANLSDGLSVGGRS